VPIIRTTLPYFSSQTKAIAPSLCCTTAYPRGKTQAHLDGGALVLVVVETLVVVAATVVVVVVGRIF
jgi:hypothetical protein